MTITEPRIAREITALHDFFADWFAGNLPNDDGLFDQAVGKRLVADFVNIQPSGKISTRNILIKQIKSGHGKNSAFRISIGNVKIRQRLPDGILLVTYEEYQRGAQNSAPNNARLSSVLLRPVDDRFEWLWVHETWLPQEQITADTFE